ncbi:uncharacterized protein LOC131620078 [Vicia villosa]|uniref:uncharacterized protein LOC131620078 n=1 Tax=Vicia villosa TaxID=3911 RepID=UPI00273CAAA4|nr:uncharacterized protein LOC131620078 [Vicia villosa]
MVCNREPQINDLPLKDIMGDDKVASKTIFGGKVVVFGGHFRQILPIVPRGTRSDIVYSIINASYIWDHWKVLKLTKNMCLRAGTNPTNAAEIQRLSKWILQVGDGKISKPNDGYAEFCIPPELIISNFDDPIEIIVTTMTSYMTSIQKEEDEDLSKEAINTRTDAPYLLKKINEEESIKTRADAPYLLSEDEDLIQKFKNRRLQDYFLVEEAKYTEDLAPAIGKFFNARNLRYMDLVKKISVNPSTIPSSNITSKRIYANNFPLFTKGDSPEGITTYVVMTT